MVPLALMSGCVVLSITAEELERTGRLLERLNPQPGGFLVTAIEPAAGSAGPGQAGLLVRTRLATPAARTPQEFTAAAEAQAAEIFRALDEGGPLPEVSGVSVELQHPVRQRIGNQTRNAQMPVYRVWLPREVFARHTLNTWSDARLREEWRVDLDVIDALRFE